MESRKIVFRETAIIALGQIICIAAMFGIYGLLGYFDRSVLLGGIAGGLLAVLNFLFMAISTSLAADRAEAQNVKGGQVLIQISFLLRFGLMFLVLIAGAKSGLCSPLAMVLPLVFTRPIITVSEFFRKSGESKA